MCINAQLKIVPNKSTIYTCLSNNFYSYREKEEAWGGCPPDEQQQSGLHAEAVTFLSGNRAVSNQKGANHPGSHTLVFAVLSGNKCQKALRKGVMRCWFWSFHGIR